jgi:hypothetical protein
LLAGETVPADEIPEATVLFLTQALWLSGDEQAASQLWKAQLPLVVEATSSATRNLHSGNSIIYLGHLSHLLCVLGESGAGLGPDPLSDVPGLHAAAAGATAVPPYSCGGSQILHYLARRCGSGEAVRLAHDSLVALMRWPSSGNPAERGSFAGTESFHSVLPLEGALLLAEVVELSRDEHAAVRDRVLDGVAFMRRLQFLPGSGALSRNPQLLEGAVRFSLVDHHFRFDYGMHASQVALAVGAGRGTKCASRTP